MRRLIKIALVAVGIRAFLRWRKSRREQASTASAEPATPDPADELRRKLAQSRVEDGPPTPASDPLPEASVADRRADVHDQARATIGEMKPTDEA